MLSIYFMTLFSSTFEPNRGTSCSKARDLNFQFSEFTCLDAKNCNWPEDILFLRFSLSNKKSSQIRQDGNMAEELTGLCDF